jgi:sugar phosphate isomerase/epimerase
MLTSMSIHRFLSILAAAAAVCTSTLHAEGPAAPGLQLYSLRSQIKLRGIKWALDQVKAQGITDVEMIGNTYDLSLPEFQKELSDRGLKAVSTHFPYDRYKTDLENVVKEAKSFGVKYAGCAWINHKDSFDEAECRDAIGVFNKAGAALAKEGIQFFYHVHGYEFTPHADGTLFDLFMKETDANNVAMEMDVLWVVYPGQDPVKLLEQYGSRWKLMHLKDLQKGVEHGQSGHTDVNHNVVLGSGQVDWPAVLAAAKKYGTEYYFIEDESDKVLDQLPQHIAYLKGIAK